MTEKVWHCADVRIYRKDTFVAIAKVRPNGVDLEIAEYIVAACNHYSEFLGSVAGLETAGDLITGQMELFK